MNTLTGCRPLIGYGRANCRIRNDRIFVDEKIPPVDTIILESHWKAGHLSSLRETLDFFIQRGYRVVLVGPTLRLPAELPAMLSTYSSLSVALNRISARIDDEVFEMDRELKNLANEKGVAYFSIIDRLCDATVGKSSCILVLDGVMPVTYDRWHFTSAGAAYVFKSIGDVVDAAAVVAAPESTLRTKPASSAAKQLGTGSP